MRLDFFKNPTSAKLLLFNEAEPLLCFERYDEKNSSKFCLAYISLAKAQAKIETTKQAWESLRKASILIPKSSFNYCNRDGGLGTQALVLMEMAQACFECGFTKEAHTFVMQMDVLLSHYSRDLQYCPHIVLPICAFYVRQGQTTSATKLLAFATREEIRQGAPWTPWKNFFDYAKAQAKLQDTEGAKKNLQHAKALQGSDYPGVYEDAFAVAQFEVKLGLGEQAESTLNKILDRVREREKSYDWMTGLQSGLLMRLASIKLERGNRQEAADLLSQVLQEKKGNSADWPMVVQLQLDLGDISEARSTTDRIVSPDVKLDALICLLRFAEKNEDSQAVERLLGEIKDTLRRCSDLCYDDLLFETLFRHGEIDTAFQAIQAMQKFRALRPSLDTLTTLAQNILKDVPMVARSFKSLPVRHPTGFIPTTKLAIPNFGETT